MQKDKQRSTKHTFKTKDRVTCAIKKRNISKLMRIINVLYKAHDMRS